MRKKLLNLKEQLKVIPMEEEEAWDIYLQISHIPKVKELFELKRQLAYISYAETDEKKYLGFVQNLNDILEALEEAPRILEELAKDRAEKLNYNTSGYKPVVE